MISPVKRVWAYHAMWGANCMIRGVTASDRLDAAIKYWNPVALIRLPFSAAVISRKENSPIWAR